MRKKEKAHRHTKATRKPSNRSVSIFMGFCSLCRCVHEIGLFWCNLFNWLRIVTLTSINIWPYNRNRQVALNGILYEHPMFCDVFAFIVNFPQFVCDRRLNERVLLPIETRSIVFICLLNHNGTTVFRWIFYLHSNKSIEYPWPLVSFVNSPCPFVRIYCGWRKRLVFRLFFSHQSTDVIDRPIVKSIKARLPRKNYTNIRDKGTKNISNCSGCDCFAFTLRETDEVKVKGTS